MEVAYRRELNETWMILPGTEEPEEYECRMLMEIPEGPFLRLNMETHGGGREYAFAISRGYSLKTLMERGSLGFTEIRQLFSGLAEVLEECEEYLLDRDHLILDPACIYGYPDFRRLRFCCHPGVREDFFGSLRHFVDSLLEHVDHQDRQAAEVLYECARVCDWPNYRFEDLMAVIGQGLTEAARGASGAGPVPEEPEAADTVPGKRELRQSGSGGELRWPRVLRGILLAAGGSVPAAVGAVLRLRTGVWDWRWFAGSAVLFVLAIGLHLAGRGGEKKERIPEENEPADRAEETAEEEKAGDRTTEYRSLVRERAASRDLYGDAPTEWIPGAWDEEATVWIDQEDSRSDPGWILASQRAGEMPIRLTHFPFVIGKMVGEVDHVLEQPTVSRIHARIEQDAEELWVVDCRSTNGTWRNGRRLPPDQRIRLEEGDEIAFADMSFRVEREQKREYPDNGKV